MVHTGESGGTTQLRRFRATAESLIRRPNAGVHVEPAGWRARFDRWAEFGHLDGDPHREREVTGATTARGYPAVAIHSISTRPADENGSPRTSPGPCSTCRSCASERDTRTTKRARQAREAFMEDSCHCAYR